MRAWGEGAKKKRHLVQMSTSSRNDIGAEKITSEVAQGERVELWEGKERAFLKNLFKAERLVNRLVPLGHIADTHVTRKDSETAQ